MDILFNMRAFVSVAETGSFTAAAPGPDDRLCLPCGGQAGGHLQTRLLHRTTRRIALTEAGQRYLMRAQQILAYIEEAEAEAGDAHARPSGTLKVHAMTGIGQHYLIKAISQYCETYPEVGFDLTLANRITDILDEGYDISVVIAPSCRTPVSSPSASARPTASSAPRRATLPRTASPSCRRSCPRTVACAW